jgi:hypothetical protein
MRSFNSLAIVGSLLLAVPSTFAATSIERIANPKVHVTEESLAPGESEPMPARLPSAIVYMVAGTAEITPANGRPHKESVQEGETVPQPPTDGVIRNAGTTPLHFVRVEFLTSGSNETWGMTGLPPNYKILYEDHYCRAYDIRIESHTREPQHTHHDRVVVSLSGAQLEHILPSGQIQPSTLRTGEVVWRLGGTHIGHNLGNTDLWVIAIEPK